MSDAQLHHIIKSTSTLVFDNLNSNFSTTLTTIRPYNLDHGHTSHSFQEKTPFHTKMAPIRVGMIGLSTNSTSTNWYVYYKE